MDFDKIKQNILNSSETSTSESESISGSELHEEFEINNFLPEFEPLKLSGKNLAQQYVSAFNTGMNVYQCLNYLQGYVYTLVTAMNETIEAWNTVVPLLEQATKEWTDEEFDYKWSILKPQVIELVTNLTIETFNKAWEDLKPVVIKLAQDTTDAEFKKQWDILKPQVITLVEETTTNKFNEEWEKLKPTIIQLSTDTTIAQFNRSWEELKPKVIELSQTTTSNKFDEKWEELRPQVIELAQTTTSNKFDEKWEELQPTLTETVNNLAKTQTTTTFNEKWEELKPQVIELAQTTTNTKFDEKWIELQPTLNTTVEDLVNTNLETFKSTLWQEVTKNDSFPFLLPENFGAVGDGVIDDHTAFNTCFTKATETGKYVLLSNKVYLISNKLTNIVGVNIIGINTQIKIQNNMFIGTARNCVFSNIMFIRDDESTNDLCLIDVFYNSQLKNCRLLGIYYLFNDIVFDSFSSNNILLDGCCLNNTCLIKNSNIDENLFVINNTKFYFDGNSNHTTYMLTSSLNTTFIFNNCNIIKIDNSNLSLIQSLGNLIFNNCYINVSDSAKTFVIPNLSNLNSMKIEFNNCNLSNNNNVLFDNSFTNNTLVVASFKDTKLNVGTIFNSDVECSLWLENNIMDTKPIINSGTGKVNIVEIQQKYSDTSENIFPWTTEPTPTVENNVSFNKAGVGEYYVLTESKDKNVKKLDYYFNYNFRYLPNALYYANTTFVIGLDLGGYTVKKSLLNNNMCKLIQPQTDPTTSELIDYVYLMLDSVTVTTTKDELLGVITQLDMKYLPYFAKLKTDTPITGQCYVDACISIILEKTSS
jgi:hypothetical protein